MPVWSHLLNASSCNVKKLVTKEAIATQKTRTAKSSLPATRRLGRC